mmetsp:Transcript_21408/g.35426  ORF Transcript_21408/g.35426 Transcript_21408/m.35426 type:complete len:245 (-) Transcript_21408:227-961(-)
MFLELVPFFGRSRVCFLPLLLQILPNTLSSVGDGVEKGDPLVFVGKDGVSRLWDDHLDEHRFEDSVGTLHHWVQRTWERNFLILFSAQVDLEVGSHSASSFIGKGTSLLVTHPCVHTTTSTVEPGNVFKAKVLAKALFHNFHCHGHHLPAFSTNLGTAAPTLTNVIIVSKIDIKNEFTLFCLEALSDGLMILGWVRKDSPDINLHGFSLKNSSLKFGLLGVGLITNVNLFAPDFNRKGPLTPGE